MNDFKNANKLVAAAKQPKTNGDALLQAAFMWVSSHPLLRCRWEALGLHDRLTAVHLVRCAKGDPKVIADTRSTGFNEETFANIIFNRILKRLNQGVRFCHNLVAVSTCLLLASCCMLD